MLGCITVLFTLCCFLPIAYFIDQYNLRKRIKKVQSLHPYCHLIENMKLKEFNKRYIEFIILCCCYDSHYYPSDGDNEPSNDQTNE